MDDCEASGVIPFDDINRAALPFVPVLVPRWVPNMQQRGDWLMGPVPWRPDRHPSFGVSLTTGRWRDFARGDHGDLIDLLHRVRGIDMKDAAKELARSIGHEWGRE